MIRGMTFRLLCGVSLSAVIGLPCAAQSIELPVHGCDSLLSRGSGYYDSPAGRLASQAMVVQSPRTEEELADYEGRIESVIATGSSESVRTHASVTGYRFLATWYLKFGHRDQALAAWASAIRHLESPANIPYTNDRDKAWMYYRWAAEGLLRFDRYEEALAALTKASQLGCKVPEKIIADLSEQVETQAAAARRRAELIEAVLNRGAAADQSGDARGSLGIYLEALATFGPEELPSSLVARAIDAASKLNPVPPIPEEARKYAVFAQTAFKEATSKSDFEEAKLQYSRVLALAPWWADAWVTLSAVHEKLGEFAVAATDLETYLRAAPRAPDRNEVQNKIYELQFKAGRTR